MTELSTFFLGLAAGMFLAGTEGFDPIAAWILIILAIVVYGIDGRTKDKK